MNKTVLSLEMGLESTCWLVGMGGDILPGNKMFASFLYSNFKLQ